jgi:aspartyl-tRNA(Asn)/glutamyl-tRNA(Gln) amidotransferase subunit A
MMKKLTELSLSEARDGLAKKEFSSEEITLAFLDRIPLLKELNAYVTVTSDIALAQAKESDARRAKGNVLPLDGLPIAIKDLYCTKGVRTTAASKILSNFIPQYESTVTANLWRDGAVMLGKVNMDEFAMGSANLYSCFGPALSPWKKDGKRLVPGGSSGGSAAAVAAHGALAATASDTGGSIRQPASFCGLTGIKPTYGRCSRYGMVAFASSLDQAGPITRTVKDSAIMLSSMAGYDTKDSTSANVAVPNYESFLGKSIKGMRIGIPKEYRMEGMNQDILSSWNRGAQFLKEAGAELVEISLPYTKYALPVYYIMAPAEASSNLARYDGVRYGLRTESADSINDFYEKNRGHFIGSEVKKRILIGTYVLSSAQYDAYYLKAQRLRTKVIEDFEAAFKQVDVILTPTTPIPPFIAGEEPKDPLTMYLNDVLTVSTNIAGLPGMSVPIGLDKDGLPLGLQLIGPAFEEGRLFQVGQVLEDAAKFPFLSEVI